MTSIDKLNEKFGIEKELYFTIQNDLIFLTISNKQANAKICLYGAQITSFNPNNSKEILWMSPDSSFEVGKPIRGGIPVCFPWFGPHKTDSDKPQHGFARLMNWDVVETASAASGETIVRMQICSTEETKAFWPHDFCAEVKMVIGKTFEVSLEVTNTSHVPFEYTCALHSYFNLSDIGNISISGLYNAMYHSQLEPGEFIQELPKIEIKKAETRHYQNTVATCIIDDTTFNRKISVAKTGSRITTVWNPGEATCASISDLPNDGYKTFVCVEAVNAFDDVIKLSPGESHTTATIIGLEE